MGRPFFRALLRGVVRVAVRNQLAIADYRSWRQPCYLLADGYAETYAELIEGTEWGCYGQQSGNPKCQNCMVHSGWEATAVHDHFSRPAKSLASALSS